MNNNVSIEVFYGPYFLLVMSLIFLFSGIYALITKRVLTPPRGIKSEWMGKRWTIIWGSLQTIVGIVALAIYLQRNELYHP